MVQGKITISACILIRSTEGLKSCHRGEIESNCMNWYSQIRPSFNWTRTHKESILVFQHSYDSTGRKLISAVSKGAKNLPQNIQSNASISKYPRSAMVPTHPAFCNTRTSLLDIRGKMCQPAGVGSNYNLTIKIELLLGWRERPILSTSIPKRESVVSYLHCKLQNVHV